MEKIVVFGGAFNPPHNVHFLLAEQILKKYKDIQKILFMPVNSVYKKNEVLVSNEHRYNMLNLMCKDNTKFEVSRLELDSPRQLYTLETLSKLKEEYPKQEIIFMAGTDNLKEFETWHKPQEILDNFKILVLERGEDNLEDIISSNSFLYKNKKAFLKLESNIKSNLSSTFVRAQIRENKEIKFFVPKQIEEYIKQNNLYAE